MDKIKYEVFWRYETETEECEDTVLIWGYDEKDALMAIDAGDYIPDGARVVDIQIA